VKALLCSDQTLLDEHLDGIGGLDNGQAPRVARLR
jgi:hypothetical protein